MRWPYYAWTSSRWKRPHQTPRKLYTIDILLSWRGGEFPLSSRLLGKSSWSQGIKNPCLSRYPHRLDKYPAPRLRSSNEHFFAPHLFMLTDRNQISENKIKIESTVDASGLNRAWIFPSLMVSDESLRCTTRRTGRGSCTLFVLSLC